MRADRSPAVAVTVIRSADATTRLKRTTFLRWWFPVTRATFLHRPPVLSYTVKSLTSVGMIISPKVPPHARGW